MKNLFLFMALLGVQTTLLSQTISRTLDAGTTFGRHLADCSAGRGACSFSVSSSEASKPADVRVASKISNSTLKFTIFRSVLTADDEYRIAGKPFSQIAPGETVVFVQDDLLLVDYNTLSNLLLDPTFNKILPGSYPLSVLKDRVEIIFTLTN